MPNSLIKYISTNKILAFASGYWVFSAVLNAATGIDICVPCIWKTLFGVECPGCGLTTAFISLLELDFKKAFESNWLIYIVLPFGVYYFVKDYIKYVK